MTISFQIKNYPIKQVNILSYELLQNEEEDYLFKIEYNPIFISEFENYKEQFDYLVDDKTLVLYSPNYYFVVPSFSEYIDSFLSKKAKIIVVILDEKQDMLDYFTIIHDK